MGFFEPTVISGGQGPVLLAVQIRKKIIMHFLNLDGADPMPQNHHEIVAEALDGDDMPHNHNEIVVEV